MLHVGMGPCETGVKKPLFPGFALDFILDPSENEKL